MTTEWISPGDTYGKYCQRSRAAGIAPKEFSEWLAYELAMASRRGPHVRLDDQERVLSVVLHAG